MWYVIATGGLGLAFVISQFFGWHTLQTNGIGINTDNGASYLYLISGMHALHVLAGLAALAVFSFSAIKYNLHLGTSIYYLTDPARKLHLDLVSMYWHFLDVVWILLVVFFLLNSIGV
jgi:cytochrome c oxidase subunit 3